MIRQKIKQIQGLFTQKNMPRLIILLIILAVLFFVYEKFLKIEGFEMDSKDIDTQVKSGTKLVLFYADWCGHCHTYKPKFDEAAKNRKSPFQVASINDEMLNSVNERIKSMNKSANINVSGYPSVVSLNNKGEFVKDLSQDAAIKMLNTPMPSSMRSPTDWVRLICLWASNPWTG